MEELTEEKNAWYDKGIQRDREWWKMIKYNFTQKKSNSG